MICVSDYQVASLIFPIIEQGVARVDHTMDPEQLAAIGRDVECMALAKAVRWHAEHRILLNGQSTVVFQ
jgi:formyltetrahydrofolate deformylase